LIQAYKPKKLVGCNSLLVFLPLDVEYRPMRLESISYN
jgi:hypothetical protein